MAGIRPLLREIQGEKCFYCGSPTAGSEELDHFVPWSLYPNDLAHNFVLACRRCNAYKSDNLASVEVLDRWIERNTIHGGRIVTEANAIGLPNDAASPHELRRGLMSGPNRSSSCKRRWS